MTNKKGKDKPEKPLTPQEKVEIKNAWAALKNDHDLPHQFLNQLSENCQGFLLITIGGDGSPVINFQPGNDVNALAITQQALRWSSALTNYYDNVFLRNLSQATGDDEMADD